MFIIGSIDFVSEEVRAHLIEEAKKYDSNEYNLFESDIAWEEWMNGFLEDDRNEDDELTEAEVNRINAVLHEAFDIAQEEKVYTVFWIGGSRDGETLGEFKDEVDAIRFAKDFYDEHEDEFDPAWGGVGITDPIGNTVSW